MKNLADGIWKAVLFISAVLFFVGTILTFINVIMRKAFNHPWTGTEELNSILLVVIVFLPLAYLELNNQQLNVSALFDIFPQRVKFWCRKLQHLVILAVSLYLSVGTWDVIVRNFEAGNNTASIGIPLYLLYLIIFIGFGLTVLTKIIQLFMPEGNGDPRVN